MSEMVEKVAEAIFRNGMGDRGSDWNAATDIQRASCLRQSRAAIEAMREPTQSMEYAGGIKCEDMMFGGDEDYTGVIFTDIGKVFRVMIDAALTHPAQSSQETK